MTHSTSSESPQSIPEENNQILLEFGDAMAVADEVFSHFKDTSRWILQRLIEEFHEHGPLHGIVAYELASGYSICVSDILDTARYLESRSIIVIHEDPPGNGDDCECDACQARRCYLQLPYSFGPDRDIAIQRMQREAERAQREAQHVARQRQRDQGYVYLIKCGPRYKIGITKDMNRRMDQLRGQSPYPIEVVHHAKGHNNAGQESTLHKRYGEYRVHGEWFEFSSEQVAEVIESMNEWAAASREGDPE